jgi:hypothetical protein
VMPRGAAVAEVLKQLYAYGHTHEFRFDAKDHFQRALAPPTPLAASASASC